MEIKAKRYRLHFGSLSASRKSRAITLSLYRETEFANLIYMRHIVFRLGRRPLLTYCETVSILEMIDRSNLPRSALK
jgi:hypothetical protein